MLMEARNSMTFRERLVYARKKKGLNQQQLAKLIGVSSGSISLWETGKYKPDMSKIRKIVKALEIPEDWLIGNDNFIMNHQENKLTKEQQKLVAENEYIIKYVFNKLHTIQNYDDFYGNAAIGLCEAARNYDTNKGVPFFAFAVPYIKFKIFKEYNKRKENFALSLDQIVLEEGTKSLYSLVPAPDEWEAVEYKILVESVYQKVEHVLTDNEKVVFRRWLHGEQNSDIARSMRANRATISLRIVNARKKCRDLINPDEIFA